MPAACAALLQASAAAAAAARSVRMQLQVGAQVSQHRTPFRKSALLARPRHAQLSTSASNRAPLSASILVGIAFLVEANVAMCKHLPLMWASPTAVECTQTTPEEQKLLYNQTEAAGKPATLRLGHTPVSKICCVSDMSCV
jgi:hypothetical protein